MADKYLMPEIKPADPVAHEAHRLNPYELAFLRSLDGGPQTWPDGTAMVWGAAMSLIIEKLHRMRLITYPRVQITDAGKTLLAILTD